MKKILPTLTLSALLLPTAIVIAQAIHTLPSDLEATVNKIANVIFTILVIVVVILFVYAGIMFATAMGDEKKIEQAKEIIKYAIIGLIVALLAKALQVFLIKMI
jgi:Na+-driven multidrug efflux pump